MTRSEKRRLKKKKVVLEVLAAGGSVAGACSVVSIARCTFYDWQEKDEWFNDGVMAIRRELMLENLSELQLQAYGRYVDEVTVKETDQGVVTTKRHRFMNGKLSALVRIQENVMDDGGPERPETELALASETGQRSMDNGEEQGAAASEGEPEVVTDDSDVGDVSGFEAGSGPERRELPDIGDVGSLSHEARSAAQPEMAASPSDAAAPGGESEVVVDDSDLGDVSGFERKTRGSGVVDNRGCAAAVRKDRKAKRKAAKASRRKNRR